MRRRGFFGALGALAAGLGLGRAVEPESDWADMWWSYDASTRSVEAKQIGHLFKPVSMDDVRAALEQRLEQARRDGHIVGYTIDDVDEDKRTADYTVDLNGQIHSIDLPVTFTV